MEHPKDWLLDAFIDDEWAKKMEKVQGRQFLRTRINGVVGQRCEVVMANRHGKRRDNIHLSGYVTEVKPEPERLYPKEHEDDTKGSYMLSGFLGVPYGLGLAEVPEGMTYKPNPETGGYLYMPRERWDKNMAEGSPSKEFCEQGIEYAKRISGGYHGTELVCEGRLHFDHDSKYLHYDMI